MSALPLDYNSQSFKAFNEISLLCAPAKVYYTAHKLGKPLLKLDDPWNPDVTFINFQCLPSRLLLWWCGHLVCYLVNVYKGTGCSLSICSRPMKCHLQLSTFCEFSNWYNMFHYMAEPALHKHDLKSLHLIQCTAPHIFAAVIPQF